MNAEQLKRGGAIQDKIKQLISLLNEVETKYKSFEQSSNPELFRIKLMGPAQNVDIDQEFLPLSMGDMFHLISSKITREIESLENQFDKL